MTQDMVYLGECSMFTWEEGIFCFWLECPEDIKVSFKPCVSLLIFCFDDLSIGVSEVLMSPAIVLLSISPFTSVGVCLIYWGAPRYLQLLCLPLGLIPWSLCSVLPYLLQYSFFKKNYTFYCLMTMKIE